MKTDHRPVAWSKEVTLGQTRYIAKVFAAFGAYEWHLLKVSVDAGEIAAIGRTKTRQAARNEAIAALDEIVSREQRMRTLRDDSVIHGGRDA